MDERALRMCLAAVYARTLIADMKGVKPWTSLSERREERYGWKVDVLEIIREVSSKTAELTKQIGWVVSRWTISMALLCLVFAFSTGTGITARTAKRRVSPISVYDSLLPR